MNTTIPYIVIVLLCITIMFLTRTVASANRRAKDWKDAAKIWEETAKNALSGWESLQDMVRKQIKANEASPQETD